MKEIKRNILLNPGPATTTDTVKLAQVVPDICPREKEFRDMMEGLRRDLVRIVHGAPKAYTSVLFCGSGTLCMDVCLNSLLPEGKKVLVVNNGAYSERAAEICEFYGLPCRNLRFPAHELPNMEAVRQALEEDSNIALVYATHQETGSGVLNPIREIGVQAHRYGATFVVDTTSTYAMRPIDIERENIDFCMASAQKGLQGMAGLSFVIGKISMIEASRAYPRRSYYCNLYQQYEFFEKNGEMHFTPPVQAVYAARQAMDEYFAEGEAVKWARHTRTFEAIHEGLASLGFQTVVKKEWQAGLVVSVAYPDDVRWDFEKVHDYCYAHGFTIYPGKLSGEGTFRLCALGAIDKGDIKAFFEVFREALRHCGVAVPVRNEGNR